MSEFGNIPTTQDPLAMPIVVQPSAPASGGGGGVDWPKVAPAMGALIGLVHAFRKRKRLMEATGEYISKRRLLDGTLYGAAAGSLPAIALSAKDGLMNKTAGVGTGAALGYIYGGPPGAGVGARIGREDYENKYHGSPGWRAFGGSAGGMLLGAILGGGAARALGANRYGRREAALLTALLGGGLGAVAGAKSVRTSPREKRSSAYSVFSVYNPLFRRL